MSAARRSGLAVLLLAAACVAPRGGGLLVTARGDAWVVTAPDSRLALLLPREGFVQDEVDPARASAGERYFRFSDAARSLIVSGWFEPDRAFPGITSYWDQKTSESRRLGLPAYRDVQFAKQGEWEVIGYELAIPNVTNSHLVAHLVRDGTWIELHASIASDRTGAENRAVLEALLSSILVQRK